MWSKAEHPEHAQVQHDFVKGRITAKDVEAYVRRIGLRVELSDASGKVFAIATLDEPESK